MKRSCSCLANAICLEAAMTLRHVLSGCAGLLWDVKNLQDYSGCACAHLTISDDIVGGGGRADVGRRLREPGAVP